MILPTNYNELSPSRRRAVREKYVEVQKGICCHCNTPLNTLPESMMDLYAVDERLFPTNFFKYPVHLHHDHSSGMTIGAVHCYCNAVLWQYHGE